MYVDYNKKHFKLIFLFVSFAVHPERRHTTASFVLPMSADGRSSVIFMLERNFNLRLTEWMMRT